MTFTIILGKWGGFYFYKSTTSLRLCLGFIAFTYHPFDLDKKLNEILIKK